MHLRSGWIRDCLNERNVRDGMSRDNPCWFWSRQCWMILERWRSASEAVRAEAFGCEVRLMFSPEPEASSPPKQGAELWLCTTVAVSFLTLLMLPILTGRNDSGEENVPLDLSRGRLWIRLELAASHHLIAAVGCCNVIVITVFIHAQCLLWPSIAAYCQNISGEHGFPCIYIR